MGAGVYDDITLECVEQVARTAGVRPALLALRLLQGDLNAINLFERISKVDTQYIEELPQSA